MIPFGFAVRFSESLEDAYELNHFQQNYFPNINSKTLDLTLSNKLDLSVSCCSRFVLPKDPHHPSPNLSREFSKTNLSSPSNLSLHHPICASNETYFTSFTSLVTDINLNQSTVDIEPLRGSVYKCLNVAIFLSMLVSHPSV